jgi:Cof subfamily protein (haloacid dehalogenase superfamily)
MEPKSPTYRLLACDLDGTLLDEDLKITPRVRNALVACQARGIIVTIATGRAFSETLPFAQLLCIDVPIICYQGGVIRHPVTNELMYGASMDRGLVLKVIELAHAYNWHLVVYIEDDLYVEELRHPDRFYKTLLGSNIRCVDDLARIVSCTDTSPAKFLFVAEPSEADYIQSRMELDFGGKINIVRSHSLFVEGNPLKVDKGDALRRVSEHLNIPRSQVVAIGDQGNDVSMINWAGLGIAMGNGSKAAQSAADWIAPPLEADGAAVAIERFLLS